MEKILTSIIMMLMLCSLITSAIDFETGEDLGNPLGLGLSPFQGSSFTIVGGRECSIEPDRVDYFQTSSSTSFRFNCAKDGHKGCIIQIFESNAQGGFGTKHSEPRGTNEFVYAYGVVPGQRYVYQKFYCDAEQPIDCRELTPYTTIACYGEHGCAEDEVLRERTLTGTGCTETVQRGCYAMEDRAVCGTRPDDSECVSGWQTGIYCKNNVEIISVITDKCVDGKIVNTGNTCPTSSITPQIAPPETPSSDRADFEITKFELDETDIKEKDTLTATITIKNNDNFKDDTILEFALFPTSFDFVKTFSIIDKEISACCPLNKYVSAQRIELDANEEVTTTISIIAPDKDSIDHCNEKLVSAWSKTFKPVAGLYRACGTYDNFMSKDEIGVGDSPTTATSGGDTSGSKAPVFLGLGLIATIIIAVFLVIFIIIGIVLTKGKK